MIYTNTIYNLYLTLHKNFSIFIVYLLLKTDLIKKEHEKI